MGQLLHFPDAAAELYAIAESVADEEGGDVYLQPFVEVMSRLDRAKHGIARHDVAAVLQAYMNHEDWGWDGGFLVELRDGRRAMIDVSADDFAWDERTRIDVAVKPAGFDYLSPDVPRDHQVRLYGFVDELPEVRSFLERLGALATHA